MYLNYYLLNLFLIIYYFKYIENDAINILCDISFNSFNIYLVDFLDKNF